MPPMMSRIRNAWNAFTGSKQAEEPLSFEELGYMSPYGPHRFKLSPGADRTIIATVTNRIALDVASFDFAHVKLDKDGRYLETVDDELHQCLNVEANLDQTGRSFIQDVVMSMFDEGVVAMVPTETTVDPKTGAYRVLSMRTGKIQEWYPSYIRVEVYNDLRGVRESLLLPKSQVGIVENPLYSIMNEPNSTLKRLIRKLSLLDVADEKTGAGKLDLIIQLPYTVRSKDRQEKAEERIKMISAQMESSQYGIAYADATERITQLNRPVDNNLLTQIQYLTNTFFNQLGMSEDIFNGKATELVLKNYYDRTVEPIVTAIVEEMRRKFLTKTARTQGHSILAFRDVFRLVPATELANIADVFSRNEILTPNEWRQILGRKPSDDPRADDLANKNMPQAQYTPRQPRQAAPDEDVGEQKRTPEEIKMEIERQKRQLRSATQPI